MGTISILIADERDIVRAGMRALLSSEQDLTIAGEVVDAKELFRLIEKESPDILLLGYPFSEKEKIRILEELTRKNSTTRTLVLLDQVSESDLLLMVRVGAKGCLPSYLPAATLKKAVRVVADGEYWVDRKTVGKLFNELFRVLYPPKPTSSAAGLLTKREIEILKMLAQGLKNRDIAERLFISEKTVKAHLSNIFAKLKIKDRLQAALYVIEHHL